MAAKHYKITQDPNGGKRVLVGSGQNYHTGDILTDKDLEANPGWGGVERLRDKLGVIEDTSEKPSAASAGDVTYVDSPGRSAEETTGSPAKMNRAAADAFAEEQRKLGKTGTSADRPDAGLGAADPKHHRTSGKS